MSSSVGAAVIEDHRLSGLNSRNLFLILQEAEKFSIHMPGSLVPGGGPHPGL